MGSRETDVETFPAAFGLQSAGIQPGDRRPPEGKGFQKNKAGLPSFVTSAGRPRLPEPDKKAA